MKIAQIAPLAERVPPKKYGGTERVVSALTEGLLSRGHDVTLFASGDSITNAKLKSVFPKGLREAKVADPHGLNEWSLLNIGEAYKHQEEFDIIHDHNSPLSLPAAQMSKTPVVMTIHSPLGEENRALFKSLNKPNLVSISKAQIKGESSLNFVGTVHNGLDFANYPFKKSPGNFLLYVGRICQDKGVHLAIDVAEKTKLPLILAAKVDSVDREFFLEKIKPRLNNQIRWIGEVNEKQRNELFTNAKAFLHPVTWPEPFGLTMIEAMACGTPVIGFNQGSVSEIVVDGKTGFVVASLKEMVESISQVDTINRETCRDYSRENFSAAKMVTEYEKIYELLLEGKVNDQQNRQLELLLANRLQSRQGVGN